MEIILYNRGINQLNWFSKLAERKKPQSHSGLSLFVLHYPPGIHPFPYAFTFSLLPLILFFFQFVGVGWLYISVRAAAVPVFQCIRHFSDMFKGDTLGKRG